MKVTVCELPNTWTDTDRDWKRLIRHLDREGSDLLLLPEMPFFRWITRFDRVDPALWQKAVEAHDEWMARLTELPVGMAITSKPVIEKGRPQPGGCFHKGKRDTGSP